MAQLPGTDVWFRSYTFRKDVRFLYTLSPNDDLTPLNAPNLDWQKRFASVQADPLNPKRFPKKASASQQNVQSLAELPAAPKQPWIVERLGVRLARSRNRK
jgi:enterochelin esterase family protein